MVSVWNLLNLVLAGAGLGVVAERRVVPTSLGFPVELAIGGAVLPATIDRLTPRSCRLIVDLAAAGRPLSPGVAGTVDALRRGGETSVLPVALAALGDGSAEFDFVALRPDHFRLIVSILYPGSDALDAFRSGRRRHKSILGGIARILAWGVTEPFRAFGLLAAEARLRRRAAAGRRRRGRPRRGAARAFRGLRAGPRPCGGPRLCGGPRPRCGQRRAG